MGTKEEKEFESFGAEWQAETMKLKKDTLVYYFSDSAKKVIELEKQNKELIQKEILGDRKIVELEHEKTVLKFENKELLSQRNDLLDFIEEASYVHFCDINKSKELIEKYKP